MSLRAIEGVAWAVWRHDKVVLRWWAANGAMVRADSRLSMLLETAMLLVAVRAVDTTLHGVTWHRQLCLACGQAFTCPHGLWPL